jgi:hypothetical protein
MNALDASGLDEVAQLRDVLDEAATLGRDLERFTPAGDKATSEHYRTAAARALLLASHLDESARGLLSGLDGVGDAA